MTDAASRTAPTPVARDEDIALRGLRHRVHIWGSDTAPPLFLLHGWMDTGMSFQFVAGLLARRWRVIAPDWRGFGDTAWAEGGYWFPDYFADLDALLDRFSPGTPARLVGHSMGGNVVWLYAGIRPDRVSHAVSLDAAGLPDTAPADAPDRYAHWLDQLRAPATFAPLGSHDAVLALVRRLAPGLDTARSEFMAAQWVRPDGRGGWRLPHDPRHKHVNPVLYRRAEAQACWRRIRAHALLVLARDARTHTHWEAGLREELMDSIPHLAVHVLDCGHMMQLEAPETVAGILDDFLV